MLQGILTQCCFPQLSTVSREVHEQLKIDFLAALPAEISYKILTFLDAISLCKAAQVSRRWRSLADDDVVWHRMCEQHIHRKCTKCGWGLPAARAEETTQLGSAAATGQGKLPEPIQPVLEEQEQEEEEQQQANRGSGSSTEASRKRQSPESEDGPEAKKQRVDGATRTQSQSQPEEERNFKTLYRDRFKIGYNWKHGRVLGQDLQRPR